MVPPAFEVVDEVLRRREIFFDKSRRAANIFFQCSDGVPFENILRRRLLPALDERAEEEVVVRVAQRVALALVHVLRVGKLGARHDVDGLLRNDLAPVNGFVQIAGEVVDLIFPEVGQRGQETALIAVKGRVADGGLCLICVAGEAAPEGRSEGGEDAGGAVTGLNVFCGERGDRETARSAVEKIFNRCIFDLMNRVFNGLLDWNRRVTAA